MFAIGDRVKPDAKGINADNEACGWPSDPELEVARGIVTHLGQDPRYVVVRWDNGVSTVQDVSYLMKGD